ncbi:TIGR01777 family oxidoreductase [Flavivirga abyssicola]|uniref:TIGR01777 family oxidoreductase n=1 Tax=Flavivirga abyssicola TaxID=3063533 RepID=UPI0026DFBB3C|nr:TIGR01777 family oxidoreductase [Flavivirga sp. MEBiC07777]WVK11803.1 TIGR01777 family oxidoreductase [Flavivirga sp. MEBiC07777]
MKTIIIAGGSGFLGQILEDYFTKKEYLVKILTRYPKRKNDIYWNAKDLGEWAKELEKTECLINLTGKSVDCRYTEKNKKLIYNSRINPTHLLGLAINHCENPPKIWMNSSTATIYKHSLDEEMTEEHGEIGDDFSMNIAKSWEQAFNTITTPKTRKIILRTSIVLGKNGGALIPLKKITKLGLGGKQGNGNQKVSWIHQLDFAKIIEFLIHHKNLSGIFNLCVPKPTNNNTLMKSLRKVLPPHFGIPHSKPFLEFGAKIIGTETELVLKSRNVIPKRLLYNGYSFKYTNIESALFDLLNI